MGFISEIEKKSFRNVISLTSFDTCFAQEIRFTMNENNIKILEKSGSWWAVESKSRAAGCIYYFNIHTGEKTWTKPASFENAVSVNNIEKASVKPTRNNLKMKTSPTKKLRNEHAGAPYPKRRSGETLDAKTGKQEKERKNLGCFRHTFSPPAKSSANSSDTSKGSSTRVPVSPSSSSSSRVSMNMKKQKSRRITEAPSNVFGEEEEQSQSKNLPGRTSAVASQNISARSALKTWLSDVPFGVINQPTLPVNRVVNINRGEKPPSSARQEAVRKVEERSKIQDVPAAMVPKLQTGPVGKQPQRLLPGEEKRLTESPLPVPLRRNGGLAEERMRRLRKELSEQLKKKEDEKKRPVPILPTAVPEVPKERKVLLPTPPESMRLNADVRKEMAPTSYQTQVNLRSKAVDHSLDLGSEIPPKNTIPPSELFQVEAMDVDEETQVLLDIKAMRTAVTWDSFTETIPMETEVIGVSLDTRSAIIIVIDTNILLTHLNFVTELRDTTKLYGNHPYLYIPWMVLQELDRLKEGNSRAAKSARAAVTFLNDSFKRKHPRVRGQTGREARDARSANLRELCPDDSILESCLQLKEQGFETWLLSNDVSLCNKALVSNMKAVTKIQLTNEIRNPAETERLLHTGRTPSPEKKVHLMDRLQQPQSNARQPQSNARQPQSNQPQPVQTQVVKPRRSVIEDLKEALLSTFSQVISTGMEAEYGSNWAKRVLYKPPWEIDKVFLCVAHHWFALCDQNTPEVIRIAAQRLKSIFQKGANDNSVNEVIDQAMEIIRWLPRKYEKIISPLENQIKAFRASDKLSCGPVKVNEVPDETSSEEQPSQSSVSPNLPPDCALVLSYFQVLWSIVVQFCTKLENGASLDTELLNQSKEMLGVIEALYSSMNQILSVPESEIKVNFASVRELFELLSNVSHPEGAEPLQLQHVYTFSVQPESRLLLRNGLSQLGNCGTFLANIVKSANRT